MAHGDTQQIDGGGNSQWGVRGFVIGYTGFVIGFRILAMYS